MKLVIFGDGITYPGKEGVSHHIISQLFALCRYPEEIEPILILCDRGTLKIEELNNFPWKTVVVPHEVYYDYRSMCKILDQIKPDTLQSYGVYHGRLISSRYSLERKIPFVMEHHDVELELTDHLKLSKGLSQSIYHDQIELCELASLNRTLSQHDFNILTNAALGRKNTFFNLPTIIEDSFGEINIKRKKSNSVLFIGNGAYAPNKQAVDFICNELALALPEVTFHIVGRLSDKIKTGSNVIGHGMLDNLKPITDEVQFGIAPLFNGSGLKIKILTYLSAGLPVVATPLAYHGFSEDKILINSSLESFSKTLKESTANYRPQQSVDARKLFITQYSEQANVRQLINTYKTLRFQPYITLSNSHPIRRDDAKLPWLKEFREMPYSPIRKPMFINFN